MQASFEKDSILVLDVDGTLTDSVRIHQRALLGAMESLEFEDLNTDWGSYPHHTDTGILIHAHAEHGRALPQPHDLARFEHEIDERFTALLNAHGLAEIPGARAFVEAAHRSRWGVVFATGGIRQVSHRKLRSVAIDYTDAMLITASEYSSREQLVAEAIKRAQVGYGIHRIDWRRPVGSEGGASARHRLRRYWLEARALAALRRGRARLRRHVGRHALAQSGSRTRVR
jgi:phosphoglycolate phosphatase-like HAD superfamily hydrolase